MVATTKNCIFKFQIAVFATGFTGKLQRKVWNELANCCVLKSQILSCRVFLQSNKGKSKVPKS